MVLASSAVDQARLIRERQISSAELVSMHLDRIRRVNPAINAAVLMLDENALTAARAADAALARGEIAGPLHGVPFTVKDSIELAGTICTAGTTGRRGAASSSDATLVSRLRAAGAIPIAKTNLPDLLFSFESDNLLFGRTNNPYDLARTSGGSSGGEAALIAACASPMGLGSDAAGSVRLPANFCGIAAIKPTSGRLPRTGHFPPVGGWIEALWQIGPMARRVEDLVLMTRLLAGPDGVDPTAVAVPFEGLAGIEKLHVAFHTEEADADVVRMVRDAARALEAEVASVVEGRPVCLDQAYDLEMKLLGADGGDGLRAYLTHLGSTTLHPLLTAWLDKLEAYRTDLAGFEKYWDKWMRYRSEMLAFLRGADVLVGPAYKHPALPHGTSVLDENFRGFRHTMAYNVAGWPAAVVRCGESESGLPIGVQIAAAPWREDIVLAIAAYLERALGGWKPAASPLFYL